MTKERIPGRGIRRGRWLIAGIVLIVVMIGAGVALASRRSNAASSTIATVAVKRGTIVATVAGSGTIAAAQSLDEPFQTNGTVTEVLVHEGDTVAKDQVLARLDPRKLQLDVDKAQSALAGAQAQLNQAKQGNATPEDLDAAKANLANAQANLEKTRQGSATTPDIDSAEAQLRNAQANLEKTRTGNYTAADIANAEAQLRSAQASLEKTKTGNYTAADIAGAEAQLRSAQANFDKAKTNAQANIANAQAQLRSAQASLQKAQSGPNPDTYSAAQNKLQQAQQNLQQVAASASANKSTAEQTMNQAADSVRQAQQAYSTAYWNNQQAQNGIDPTTGKSFSSEHLDSDIQKRQYADALKTADLNLSQAQSKLEQAKVAYQNAQQQEASQVAAAQAQVDDAQVALNEVQKGPKPEDVTVAQAQVDQAQANLDQLTAGGTDADIRAAQASVDQAAANLQKMRQGGTPNDIKIAQASVDQAAANLRKMRQGGTAADIAAAQAQVDQAAANVDKVKAGGGSADVAGAQAQVDQAQANLDKLTAPKTASDVSIQQANVTQAEQTLKQAQLDQEGAVLKAPFAGVVTAVNVVPGSTVTSGGVALTLVDRSTLHVDLKLSENDIVRVEAGQSVALSIDSLSGWQATGTVSYIAPVATTTNDVVTYAVRVSFPDSDPAVKVGMTANVDVTTARKDNVLLVPTTALLPKGSGHSVQILNPDGKTTREVDVQTGLSDGTQTEITKGLNEGDKIVTLPTTPQRRTGGFGG